MKHSILFGLGTALLSLGLALGGYYAGTHVSERVSTQSPSSPIPAYASASNGSDGVVIATGAFSTNAEAMYYLDSQSCRLTAALISRTDPAVQKSWVRNIRADLVEAARQLQVPAPAAPKFLMTTGEVDIRNVGTVGVLSKAFLYVAEINTGIVFTYALPGASDRDLFVKDGEIMLWTFARLSDGLQTDSGAAPAPAAAPRNSDPQLIDQGFYRTR